MSIQYYSFKFNCFVVSIQTDFLWCANSLGVSGTDNINTAQEKCVSFIIFIFM